MPYFENHQQSSILRALLRILIVVAVLGSYVLLFSALLRGSKEAGGLLAFGLLFVGVLFGAGALVLAILLSSYLSGADGRPELLRRFLRGFASAWLIFAAAGVVDFVVVIQAARGSFSGVIDVLGIWRVVVTAASIVGSIVLFRVTAPRVWPIMRGKKRQSR
jgi:hypothetical protein